MKFNLAANYDVMREKIKNIFGGNNAGITICFAIFFGSLIYLYIKGTPVGSLMFSIAIGYSCYIWGYLKGIEKTKNRHNMIVGIAGSDPENGKQIKLITIRFRAIGTRRQKASVSSA